MYGDPPRMVVSTPTPTGPFNQVGPEYVQEYLARVDAAVQRMALLARELQTRKRPIPFSQALSGQTDGSGNLDVWMWTVPAGMIASVHRVIVEAQGFTPITAAIASGWLGVYNGANAPLGGLIDFTPRAGANAGLVFPAVSTDAANAGAYYRDGAQFWLHIVGTATLASKQVVAKIQGIMFQQGGTHVESD